MKNSIIKISALISLVILSRLLGQSVKIGYNVSTFNGKAPDLNGNNIIDFGHNEGYCIGFSFDIDLYKRFSLVPEINYTSKGAHYSAYQEYNQGGINLRISRKVKYSLNYFETPVLLKIPLYKNLDIFAGPVLSAFSEGTLKQKFITTINGEAKISSSKNPVNRREISRPDYGYIAGFSWKQGRFFFEGRYSYSLNSVFDSHVNDSQNRLAQILLGYSFKKSTKLQTDNTALFEATVGPNSIYSCRITKGEVKRPGIETIHDLTYYHKKIESESEKEFERILAFDKIHPTLKQWIADSSGRSLVKLIVTFQDTIQIPRLPIINSNKSINYKYNQAVQAQTKIIIDNIKYQRSLFYNQIRMEFTNKYEAEILEEYWLIQGMALNLKLDRALDLANRKDVIFIEPMYPGEKPPLFSATVRSHNNKVAHARELIRSDAYFSQGGWLALLDTGIYSEHDFFQHLDTSNFLNSATTTGLSPDDVYNHGTSSAAILLGKSNNTLYNGITDPALFVNLRVYNQNSGLDVNAAILGFQVACSTRCNVIVAEIQNQGNSLSSLSNVADGAFDAGSIVIAANGNNGPSTYSVNSPANAHKVIGVGAYNTEPMYNGEDNGIECQSQSCGPTEDQRIKPDIQAPTRTETASKTCPSALHIYSGTSGSTPYAAGAALLLYNLVYETMQDVVEPGYINALLILSGQKYCVHSSVDQCIGAGPIILPQQNDGVLAWGKVILDQNQNAVKLSLPFQDQNPDKYKGIEAAIWWPENDIIDSSEGRINQHTIISLSLWDNPTNNFQPEIVSCSPNSIFQSIKFNHDAGNFDYDWRLEISGGNFSNSQTVYYSMYLKE